MEGSSCCMTIGLSNDPTDAFGSPDHQDARLLLETTNELSSIPYGSWVYTTPLSAAYHAQEDAGVPPLQTLPAS